MRKGTKLLFGNIWKYILVAIVVIFIWSAVFESLGQIKDNQRLTIAVYNLECDTQTLRDDIYTKLPELTQQELLELYVDDMEHIPNQTYASSILATQLLQSDLVIMPESLLKELDMAYYFPELPAQLQSNPAYGYYQVNGVCYGILMNGPEIENTFTKYCHADEPCYLLLSGNSVNLAGLLNRGEATDDAGLRVLEYLLKETAQ